jgi:ubiquinone/menaquinone biosynthesis C-methylase UbiE
MPLAKRRVLDVGCGTGELLSRFLRWGATPSNLFGVDLMPERIRAARQAHPGIDFRLANAETLPFPDSHFDLVSVFTVFTSILDPRMAANMSAEIRRILQAGGRVLWYDFRYNNPFNPNVRAYSKSRILQLFPGFTVELETITLLPPLVRRLGPLTGLLYGPLNRLPCLRSHWLGILTKH